MSILKNKEGVLFRVIIFTILQGSIAEEETVIYPLTVAPAVNNAM